MILLIELNFSLNLLYIKNILKHLLTKYFGNPSSFLLYILSKLNFLGFLKYLIGFFDLYVFYHLKRVHAFHHLIF